MIFVLDNTLQDCGDDAKYQLARLIFGVVRNGHYVDSNPIIWGWIKDNILVEDFLARYEIELIGKNKNFRDPSSMLKNFLSKILIGYEAGMITPHEAQRLIDEPSYIVVENENNDWPVVRNWIDLLKNDKTFKTINSLVENKKNRKHVRPYNAGSSGQIVNILTQRQQLFGRSLAQFKVMALYDSDKKAYEEDFSNEKKKIADCIDEYGLVGHILYKREMENYFPLECYKRAGLIDDTITYSSNVGWDFEDIETFIKNSGSKKKYEKSKLPTLAQYINREELIDVVKHHPVGYLEYTVNEIQLVILKIAKMI